jgi:hypothetical protein
MEAKIVRKTCENSRGSNIIHRLEKIGDQGSPFGPGCSLQVLAQPTYHARCGLSVSIPAAGAWFREKNRFIWHSIQTDPPLNRSRDALIVIRAFGR